MFTGIIQRTGTLKEIRERKSDTLSLVINCGNWETPLAIGESIAVDGVCLTVTEATESSFSCDILKETMRKTTLGTARAEQMFNLERALRVGDMMGGHIVTGHIDGVGEIITKTQIGNDWQIVIRCPKELSKYIVKKGSVAVDGISLTVVNVEHNCFEVHLIPHTSFITTLGIKAVGMQVNIETDVLAKYVEKLLLDGRTQKVLTMEDLEKAGFS